MTTTNALPLDAARLQELRALFEDDGELTALFRDFVSDIPGCLEELRAAIRGGEPELVLRAAHRLKGSSGNLGAGGVQEAAREMEDCGRRQDLRHAAAMLARLERELADLEAWLREHNLV